MPQCKYGAATNGTNPTGNPIQQAAQYGIGVRTIRRHNAKQCICYGKHQPSSNESKREKPVEQESGTQDGTDSYTISSDVAWGYEDFVNFIRTKGQDPEKVTFDWGVTTNPAGGVWNKLNRVRPRTGKDGEPAWPVIQQAQPVIVNLPTPSPAPKRNYKLALKSADHQIGYRRLDDGTLDPFHDQRAMDIFTQVCAHYQPDKIQILGDFLDLPSQSRWAQEASFARTTQPALDAAHAWLAQLRAVAPNAEMIIIEGNHDKRMQNFVEANALAAFGLKRANMPNSWPTMSIPYLLRLEELNIQYVDAYPAATDWDNDTTRNIHGTRANSRGSTTAQYIHELPHLNTWAGHTHRAEITYHSVMGARGEALRRYSANPGAMCRVDGSVPSVNGAIGADGKPAKIVEQWQQGIGFAYYDETESWPFVYQIIDGRTIVDGKEYTA